MVTDNVFTKPMNGTASVPATESFGQVATPQAQLSFTNSFIRIPSYTGRNFDTYTVSGVEGETMDEDTKLIATVLAAKALGLLSGVDELRQKVNDAFKAGQRPVNFWTRVPNGYGVNAQGQVYQKGSRRPTPDS